MRRVIVVLAAVAVLAAGCGGGGGSSKSSSPPLTKAQYQAKLQQLSNEVGAELRQSIGASTTTLKQSDIPKLQDSLRSFAGKVAALSPPVAVEDLNTRLVAAVRGLADDLPKLLATVNKTQDPSAAIAALFGAKPIQALITLQQAYKDKGYDISSLLDAGSGP